SVPPSSPSPGAPPLDDTTVGTTRSFRLGGFGPEPLFLCSWLLPCASAGAEIASASTTHGTTIDRKDRKGRKAGTIDRKDCKGRKAGTIDRKDRKGRKAGTIDRKDRKGREGFRTRHTVREPRQRSATGVAPRRAPAGSDPGNACGPDRCAHAFSGSELAGVSRRPAAGGPS